MTDHVKIGDATKIAALPRTLINGGCPYVGTRPFDELNQELFFGRETDAGYVAAKIEAKRLTVLYGPTGVGKTSLLLAGVVPFLKKAGEHIVYHADWNTEDPLGVLKSNLIKNAKTKGVGPDDPLIRILRNRALDGRLIVILDQYEEYLLHTGGRQHDQELQTCLNSADPDIHFVLAMREDCLFALERFGSMLPSLLQASVRVPYLSSNGAKKAITGPLQWFCNATVPTIAVPSPAAGKEETGPEGSDASDWRADDEAQRIATERRHEAVVALAGAFPKVKSVVADADLVDAIIEEVKASSAASVNDARPSREEDARPESLYLQMVMESIWQATWVDAGVDNTGTLHLSLATYRRLGGEAEIRRTFVRERLRSLTDGQRFISSYILMALAPSYGRKQPYSAPQLMKIFTSKPTETLLVSTLKALVREGVLRTLGKEGADNDDPNAKYQLQHDMLGTVLREWCEDEQNKRATRKATIRATVVAATIVVICLIAFLAVVGMQFESEQKAYLCLASADFAQGETARAFHDVKTFAGKFSLGWDRDRAAPTGLDGTLRHSLDVRSQMSFVGEAIGEIAPGKPIRARIGNDRIPGIVSPLLNAIAFVDEEKHELVSIGMSAVSRGQIHSTECAPAPNGNAPMAGGDTASFSPEGTYVSAICGNNETNVLKAMNVISGKVRSWEIDSALSAMTWSSDESSVAVVDSQSVVIHQMLKNEDVHCPAAQIYALGPRGEYFISSVSGQPKVIATNNCSVNHRESDEEKRTAEMINGSRFLFSPSGVWAAAVNKTVNQSSIVRWMLPFGRPEPSVDLPDGSEPILILEGGDVVLASPSGGFQRLRSGRIEGLLPGSNPMPLSQFGSRVLGRIVPDRACSSERKKGKDGIACMETPVRHDSMKTLHDIESSSTLSLLFDSCDIDQLTTSSDLKRVLIKDNQQNELWLLDSDEDKSKLMFGKWDELVSSAVSIMQRVPNTSRQ